MRSKKGFISISIIYTFFIVFLLIMLSMLASYLNKRYLKNKIIEDPPDDKFSPCLTTDTLSDCLFKAEAYEAKKKDYKGYYAYLSGLSISDVAGIATKIKNRTIDNGGSNIVSGNPNDKILAFASGATEAESMYSSSDEWGNTYFYRGDVDNNYVSFAGFLWRVVRMSHDSFSTDDNGDLSVRLILTDIPDESKSTLLAGGVDRNISNTWSCFNLNKVMYSKGNEDSLITMFNRPDSHFLCETEVGRLNAGLMYNEIDNISDFLETTFSHKDFIYANNTASDILNTLYNFFSSYLDTNQNKISNDALFCADKNVVKDKKDGKIGSEITELCQNSFSFSLNQNICSNPWFELLSTGLFKMDYYRSMNRIDSGVPSYICEQSCATATDKSGCHTATNLSTYSANDAGKVIYNIEDVSSSCGSWSGLLKSCTKYWEYYRRECVDHGVIFCRKWETKKHTSNVCVEWSDENISFQYKQLAALADQDKAANKYYSKKYGNGQLDVPIGLISADEAMFSGVGIAGGSSSISSDNSAFANYWTGSLAYVDRNNTLTQELTGNIGGLNDRLYSGDKALSDAYYYVVNESNQFKYAYASYIEPDNNRPLTARPVISLRSTCKYKSGSGTHDDPYIIGDC